ncbi:hypothetical protein ES703_93600 [subsurface metagenome]
MIPSPVIPSALRERAIPKSIIRAFPSLSIMMFRDFKSLCTTPRWCASASPSHICLAMETALPTLNCPVILIMFFKSSPGTYSIVMYGVPSSSLKSYIRQTFLWVILRASLSSFLKRLIVFSSAAIAGCKSLSAISSLIFLSTTL